MKTQRGFTLLEMLTVVAIIGILSSVATVSYSGAREKARDTERVTEVGQIVLALEMYYNACRQYPATLALTANNGSCPTGVTLASFLDTIPTDPQGSSYVYVVSGTNDEFLVKAELERASPELENDLDGSQLGGEDCDDPFYCKN